MQQVQYDQFEQLEIRVGQIVAVELLPNAKYSTHKLTIDFGPEIGIKKSAARLVRYTLDELKGRLVLGVVNFPPRQIGQMMSEVLTLGVPGDDGDCVLVQPERDAPLGGKLY